MSVKIWLRDPSMGEGSHERQKKEIELDRQDKDLLSIYMFMN